MFNGWQRPQGMPQGLGMMQRPMMPQGQMPGMPQGQGIGQGMPQGMPLQMPQGIPMGGMGGPMMPQQQMPPQGLSAAPPPSAMNQLAVNPGAMAAPPPSMGAAPAPMAAPSTGQGFARGGMPPMAPGPAMPAPAPKGLIASPVAGRTDRLPMNVAPNSYVIPADVVSGLGQGNTMAGGRILDAMFGLPAPSAAPPNGAQPPANGHVPIITAGGEWIASPEIVAQVGGGDPKKGHQILDKMVKTIRAQVIHQLKNLPGPKK